MDELMREHSQGRERVRKLVEAKDLYVNGYADALPHIAKELKELVDFYPKHIEKEDKHFFFPCLDYFTEAEQDRMLREFRAFDQNMIHEKYRTVVETFLGKKVMRPAQAG
jgi:hemerythrin-like domain-containing protein